MSTFAPNLLGMLNFRVFIITFCVTISAYSQKELSLEKCEAQFLEKNLFLLASNYNIEASKALVIQAKIWDNPTFSSEVNAINPQNNRYFDVGAKGQKAFAIQQIIYLGGDKKNQVGYARANEEVAVLEFQDILRRLKFQLRKSFYLVYFNNKKIESMDAQIANIDTLVKSFAVQTQKGNLPLIELVRLQSLLLNFKNLRIEIVNNNIEEQANLQLLLNEDQTIVPTSADNFFEKYIADKQFNIAELDTIAVKNRPDFLLKLKQIEANEWNVKWQKSIAIPDMNIGAGYDQRGGAFVNQTNITFGIPIPLWNRNQGNIKYARTLLDQSKVDKELTFLQLKTEVTAGVNKWKEARYNYSQLSLSTVSDFEKVYTGVLTNFQRRNVSILEFTDFMESYNQMSIQLNEFKKNIIVAGEEINIITNSAIF